MRLGSAIAADGRALTTRAQWHVRTRCLHNAAVHSKTPGRICAQVEVSRANEGMWEQQRAGSHQRLVDAEAAATAKLQRELHLLQQCQAMLQSSLQESHSIANAVAQEAVDEPDTTPSDGTLMGAGAEDASRQAAAVDNSASCCSKYT